MARSFLRSYVSLLFFPQVQRILWKKREPSKDGSLFCLGKVPPPLQRSTGTLRRGGYYPPANPHQPLRLVATGALSTSSLPDSPRITQPAAAAQKRSQSAVPAAPALRYGSPGSVPRNGVRGKADMEDRAAGRPSDCGVPRRSFGYFPIAGKVTSLQKGRRISTRFLQK